ncbi:UDP-N-acetylmuramoyl-tripeptide--D-alanyl-D-alanine ligase [Cardiobacteriaceae bacterium TAE3-ERU3]|nr:UDP-N-acetylmuramoyl-tripeptide--D-alanyl-D-alanine ligase [Cardiobacteriaceae bacterium TAE3-ERU3]
MQLKLSDVAELTGGVLHGNDVPITTISTDTRTLNEGALFIALRGDHFDGDKFVATAKEQGATAAIVHNLQAVDLPQITVSDTRAALAALARAHCRSCQASVIALTGSNGKTTTKELLHRLLSERGKVLATQGNLNNDIGVPLTLLRLQGDEDFAVVEMGANHEGEIARLVAIAEPETVLVTNVSAAHLEGFGSLDGVIRAKGEMLAASADAHIALNLDLPCAQAWQKAYGERIGTTFALDYAADITALNIAKDGRSFTLVDGEDSTHIDWQLVGRHNIANALAAFAVAKSYGVSVEDAAKAWSGLRLTQSRLTAYQVHGNTVYDDTYNANPASFKAGIDVLAGEQPTLVVAGAMGELGEHAQALHQEVADYAQMRGIGGFWCVGEGAAQYGMETNFLRYFDDHVAAATALKAWLEQSEGGVVLVKGSRSARMERVIELAGINSCGH